MSRTGEFSNQFPIKPRERRTTGTLWYNGKVVNDTIGLLFCELNKIKSDMIYHGYKRELFKITY